MRALKLAEAKLQNVDSVQADYMLHDQCILVDEQDKVIGSASKGACHHVDSAALHRAFSVFLFTPDRKLVLQKRSASKITFPLVWTNSCCSHPLCAEDEMEPEDDLGVRRAASRKLEHELGIKDMSVERLNVMGRYVRFEVVNDMRLGFCTRPRRTRNGWNMNWITLWWSPTSIRTT